MENISLESILRKSGAATLSNLIGQNKLESICAIMQDKVTEKQLVNILMSSHSTQILANKKIRQAITRSLSAKKISYLVHGNEKTKISEKDLLSLDKFRWSRKSVITHRFLELFNLEETYLPPIKEKVESQTELITDVSLYPYQKKIKDKFVRDLLSNQKRILIHMPTGSGKTRTSIEGLVDYWRAYGEGNGFLIWLTDSEELCQQAEETFTKLWKIRGDRKINLIRLWGEHRIDTLDDKDGLIIASLQKLNRLRTSASNKDFKLVNQINTRSKLIVVDEAHKSIAPTYKATIEFICDLQRTILVGLTATPGRTNESEVQKLVRFYGNKKITLTDSNGKEIADPVSYLQQNGYLSLIERIKVPTNITIDLTQDECKQISEFFEISPRVLLELSQNDQRNAIIVKEIAKLYESEHQIIVFACSVDHAHMINDLLMIRGIESRCIDGKTPSVDRKNSIDMFKTDKIKVLVNYGVLTTGFDAPNTNAVVITRPTASLVLYSQMIGRGIRGPKMGGTKECKLIDLEDNLIGYPSEERAFKYFDSYWK